MAALTHTPNAHLSVDYWLTLQVHSTDRRLAEILFQLPLIYRETGSPTKGISQSFSS